MNLAVQNRRYGRG